MKKSTFWMTLLGVASGLLPVAFAEDIAPASKRYADGSADTPDFRKHVMPLLGRLGCNGRACHGSFQGQGGFRLSLFGYDADLDHKGLAERVDLEKPESSYALQKALLEEPHRGGKRFEAGSWEHKLLTAWIKGGAKKTGDGDEVAKLKSVEIEPKEILFTKDGDAAQLKVFGLWSDGTREDVTCLCRFQTNDELVAEISKDGRVSGKQAGDTHIVVFYDNTVTPIPVMRPVSDKTGDKYPAVETKTKIDELVQVKLRKLGVVPSEVAGDMEFLRRVSLDLIGTLPAPQEIQAFVADTDPNKRAKKVDELLEQPAYAAWWATRLCDWTGNTNNQSNNGPVPRDQMTRDWYEWIRDRLVKNVPYDQIAEGFVMANTRNKGESYKAMCEDLTKSYYQDKTGAAHRDSVPHYWTRNNFRTAEDRTIGFAYNFMGVRIQCAQCHKHPFDQWTQDDFHQFKNFFTHTKGTGRGSDAKEDYDAIVAALGVDMKKGMNQNERQKLLATAAKEGKVLPFEEVNTPKVAAAKESKTKSKEVKPDAKRVVPSGPKARLLGAGDVDLSLSDDPRQPLMDWLRSKDNPFFAKAFVNRVWANYFNVGIVQPADDHNLANPPSNKALLDYLSTEFIAHNFDIKWLHREICSSATYQRTWAPNETNKLDERNFSHAVPRRLPAEVAYDAVRTVAANDDDFAAMKSNVARRAIAIPGSGGRPGQGNAGQDYALSLFGRSIRESNCDCDRSADASLLQTVYLQNDSEVLSLIKSSKGWFGQASRDLGLAKVAEVKKDDNSTEVAKIKSQRERAEKALKKAESRNDAKNAEQMKSLIAKLDEQIAKLSGKTSEEKPADAAPAPMSKDRVVNVVKSAYLRTLSRMPSDDELNRSVAYIESSSDPMNGAADVLWALINTKEFIVNH